MRYSSKNVWYIRYMATFLWYMRYLPEKKPGHGGFHLNLDFSTNFLDANGTLTTTIDGMVYENPASYT
ncbi:hypothetical protein B0O99DRAFT_617536 [Bisporella sp. PMI_857]|nr:hypothetical protein B0O99DRAFT_617536 [Bisporella sp. PMI_857]